MPFVPAIFYAENKKIFDYREKTGGIGPMAKVNLSVEAALVRKGGAMESGFLKFCAGVERYCQIRNIKVKMIYYQGVSDINAIASRPVASGEGGFFEGNGASRSFETRCKVRRVEKVF